MLNFCSTAGSVELTNDEQEEVKMILSPLGVNAEELDNVYSVLRKAHSNTASIQVGDNTLKNLTLKLRIESSFSFQNIMNIMICRDFCSQSCCFFACIIETYFLLVSFDMFLLVSFHKTSVFCLLP